MAEKLDKVQKKRLEYDKVNDLKDGLKHRFNEILETINSRGGPTTGLVRELFASSNFGIVWNY